MQPFAPYLDRVLVSEEEIKAHVARMGAEISRDYQDCAWGDELLCIGILKGSFVFLADLMRAITVPATLDFMAVSSYGDATKSSGVVRILKDLDQSIHGRRVLLVEDIIDTGLTLAYLIRHLQARGPRSIRVATLLDKPSRRQVDVAIDYKGAEIPDAFVVGYGLDWNERFRNLPFVAVLKPEAYR